MSAPHEVFVEIAEESGLPIGVATSCRDGWNKHPVVRYLRANLTCGECAKQKVLDCPHSAYEGDDDEGPTGSVPADDVPACMAFVPKEEAK